MKLEDQVCSIESARRLKELGVPQDSLFYWCFSQKDADYCVCYAYDSGKYPLKDINCSAFTAGELGELLPKIIVKSVTYGIEYCTRLSDGPFGVFYASCSGAYGNLCWIVGKTEAEARAKCLIYLLENKLMEITE